MLNLADVVNNPTTYDNSFYDLAKRIIERIGLPAEQIDSYDTEADVDWDFTKPDAGETGTYYDLEKIVMKNATLVATEYLGCPPEHPEPSWSEFTMEVWKTAQGVIFCKVWDTYCGAVTALYVPKTLAP